jgi:type I restriction enzyme M protein
VDAFNEMFKVVFAKIYDEKMNLGKEDSKCEFRIGITERPEVAAKRIRDLFEKSKEKWKGVFQESDYIKLNDYNLVYTASALQKAYLLESNADVLGMAFETMINPDFKSDMGQYFTPRQVIRMCVEMLNPKEDEKVCDPACGSGGFLIYCMDHVYKTINESWDKKDEAADHRKDYSQQNVWGVDYDDRLEKVAKAYMLIWGDGRSNVRCFDSLDYNSWDNENKRAFLNFDVVLTNPPFAGHQQKAEILSQFDLAFKGDPSTNEISARQSKAVLFIERCIKLLKPGGRMCIVLPQGILNNLNDGYIRDYIDKQARILAVIGLHENTFKPFTTPKTSVLFLQKWNKEEYLADYKIFFGVSLFPGKDKRGNNIYKGEKMRKGFKIKNKKETKNTIKEIDTDLYDIATEFRKFATKEGLKF